MATTIFISRAFGVGLLVAALVLPGCAGRRGPGESEEGKSSSQRSRRGEVLLPGQSRTLPSEDPRNQPAPDGTTVPPFGEPGSPVPAETTATAPGQTTIAMPEPVSIGPETEADARFRPPAVPSGEVRYRVQVLATVRLAKALDLRERLAAAVGEGAFIEREQGIFKVRVGNEAGKETAQNLRRRLIGLGYDDAFIVELKGR